MQSPVFRGTEQSQPSCGSVGTAIAHISKIQAVPSQSVFALTVEAVFLAALLLHPGGTGAPTAPTDSSLLIRGAHAGSPVRSSSWVVL